MSRTASDPVLSLLARALRPPLWIARETFDWLPEPTQGHIRAAVTESAAALRSLAEGATETAERAIDRIGTLISRQ